MYRQDTSHSAAFPCPFLKEKMSDKGGEPSGTKVVKNRIEPL